MVTSAHAAGMPVSVLPMVASAASVPSAMSDQAAAPLNALATLASRISSSSVMGALVVTSATPAVWSSGDVPRCTTTEIPGGPSSRPTMARRAASSFSSALVAAPALADTTVSPEVTVRQTATTKRTVARGAAAIGERYWRGDGVPNHSHSMVAGGLLEMSRTTRLTSSTSFVMRVEMRSSTSVGRRAQSAVIASSLVIGRSTIGCAYVRPSPCTPTERTSARSTTGNCHTSRSSPGSFELFARMASASRTVARRAASTAPTMRIARPGPGNGWRQTIDSGNPNSRPTARTSSLNSDFKRLDELEAQVVGKTAHVVVALDVGGAGAATRLDDVGIERALHQELDRRSCAFGGDHLGGDLLEGADELGTDDLALRFGVGDPGSAVRNFSDASTVTSRMPVAAT